MEKPPLHATASDISSFAREWVRFAAENGLDAALALIDRGENDFLSASVLATMSENHFDDGASCTLTDPDEIEDLRVDVYEYKDGSGFAVDHDLAMNHRRSDFTAQFDFRKSPAGYVVHLDDIHVL